MRTGLKFITMKRLFNILEGSKKRHFILKLRVLPN